MVNYNSIVQNNYMLSPHQLQMMDYPNKHTFKLSDLLLREIQKTDNGTDIGSNYYMTKSPYKFLKTRIVSSDSFIANLSSEASFEYMNKNAFINQDLREGDIIISKDSNIGESCILSEDLPNCMLASAFYKLPITDKNKYYIFAFMKTSYFKKQLNSMVPRGATIKHAGTKFLNCKIPFPNCMDAEKIIARIEQITQDIVKNEKQIYANERAILSLIQNELNTESHVSQYAMPRYTDLLKDERLDAGYHCEHFRNIKTLIQNYSGGYSTLEGLGYSVFRGQNLQTSCIGESIESNTPKQGFYKVVKPTNLSNYGTIVSYNYLGNSKELDLLMDGDILFSAEGTIGKCALISNVHSRKIITNIHGIILRKLNYDIVESSFVCCFLRFLRHTGYFDYLSVGGQGGSLATQYWNDVIIPIFPSKIMKRISELYCNLGAKDVPPGIVDLAEQNRSSKKALNKIFDAVIADEYLDYETVVSLIH